MRTTLARISLAAAVALSAIGATAGAAAAGQNSSAVVSLGKLGRVELTAAPADGR